MNDKRLALVLFALLALAQAAAAEGDSSKAKVPVGPPQPRVVAPMAPQALPPRKSDESWLSYQNGVYLFGQRRLGEALIAFKKAVELRASLSEKASSDVEAALASKEAVRAKGSLIALARLLALRDMIPQECDALRERSGGSIESELAMIRERSPSNPLHGLVEAALLVADDRGMSRVGDSLEALRKEAAGLASYPEAEYWIGKIYMAEGESRLAELQLIRACDEAASLELEGDRFEMLEALAGIYKSQGDLKDYEARLREITDASDLFAKQDEYYRNAMERTLARQGFDKFMLLYRVGQGFAIGAYSELGALYLEAGRPIATIYLAAAANAALSRSMADIRIDEPDYAYPGLAGLASKVLSDPGRARYANEVGLWKCLVRLGQALSATGDRDTAREVWTAVAASAVPDPWRKRAADLLKAPSISGARH
jgi:hypothetical protein